MPRTVFLPKRFNLSALHGFTREIVSSVGKPISDEFTFDFKVLNFIDGTGYTVLSNTIGWLRHQGIECKFQNFDDHTGAAIEYLDDCGFFHQYVGHRLRVDAGPRSTTLPCTSVAHADSFAWLEHRFSPWLGDALQVSHGALGSVRTCVAELFHNISDHSSQNTGFVHVQHYPNVHQVKITVSDFGRGIPDTIRGRFGDMSDAKAIAHACTEGVTAQSRPSNMGAGLNYLIETVANNQGAIRIFSLSGSLDCFRANDGAIKRIPSLGKGTYPGTLVDISLDTRLFAGDDDERVQLEW